MPRGKFDSTNQKHYPDLGSEATPVWNFCAAFQTSFGGETSGSVAICRLFSQARYFAQPRPVIVYYWSVNESVNVFSTKTEDTIFLRLLQETRPPF